MRFKTELSSVLSDMGMASAFDPQLADFSGMTGKKDLFISFVVHEAYVDVNEEGTEAAAATATGLLTASAAPRPVFVADHPFLFFIRDRVTGAILFMGRVTNPSA
jgi:serpin B